MNVKATQGFYQNALSNPSQHSLRFGNQEEAPLDELPEISDQEREALYKKGGLKGGITAILFCGFILAGITFANAQLKNLNERVLGWNKTLNKQIQQMQKELAEKKALEKPKNP